MPLGLAEKKSVSSVSAALAISQSLSKPLSEDESEVPFELFGVTAVLEFNANFLRLEPDDITGDELEPSVMNPELSAPDSTLKLVGTASRIVSRLLERFKEPFQVPAFCSSILMNSSCSLSGDGSGSRPRDLRGEASH
jgi:hypothetical protein